jgi:hypothetical protein
MMSLLALLPYLFQLISFFLDRYKASEETKRRFIALVQSAKDDGLIAVQAKDEFERQKEKLKQDPGPRDL